MPYQKVAEKKKNKNRPKCGPYRKTKVRAKLEKKKNLLPDLSLKEKLFTEEYLRNNGNASAAARAAGYVQVPSALRTTACRLLAKANVQAHIQARIAEAEVSTEEIIGTLASHMRGDLTAVLERDGSIDIAAVRERGLGHLIKKLKLKHVGGAGKKGKLVVEGIEVHDSHAAAKELARIKGMGVTNLNFSGSVEIKEQERQVRFLVHQIKSIRGKNGVSDSVEEIWTVIERLELESNGNDISALKPAVVAALVPKGNGNGYGGNGFHD